ncbi:MAG: FtsQ-type protein, partial [Deltaproteobacteria bacterium]|nr:FtsQ-type protein [Deltaproteobacteria bacterium]
MAEGLVRHHVRFDRIRDGRSPKPAPVTALGNQATRRPRRRSVSRDLRRLAQVLLLCLLVGALSLLFVRGYQLLLTSSLLSVARIQVNGCTHLQPETVIQQAGIHPGDNILGVDLAEISRRVSSHPWVESAVIIREIPDSIRIDIVEREPLALVRGRAFYLVDPRGRAFVQAFPAEYPGLPIISGMDPANVGPGWELPQEAMTLLSALYRDCQDYLPWRLISEIQYVPTMGLKVYTLRGGIAITLGTGDYGARMARLGRVLRHLEERGLHHHLRGIDLAYRDRVFVRGTFRKDRLQ